MFGREFMLLVPSWLRVMTILRSEAEAAVYDT